MDDEVEPQPFEADIESWCEACDLAIYPGERVVYDRPLRAVIHQACQP